MVCIWEAEAGRAVSSRPSKSMKLVPDNQVYTVQNTKKERDRQTDRVRQSSGCVDEQMEEETVISERPISGG